MSGLQLLYTGSLANAKWMSLVDQTLNSNFPCSDGTVAAALLDDSHSGSVQAGSGTKVVQMDTTAMSTSKTFAVCYTEADGGASAAWVDAGIRLVLSKA